MASSTTEPDVSLARSPRFSSWKNFITCLGPGLITGAADDDPSGIGAYSLAGAVYGYALLWTMFFSLPLVAAIQEISARIGRTSGRGLAGNLRRHYSPWVLYPVVVCLVVANTINLGADIGAMGDALKVIVGGPALLYAGGFAVACVVLPMFASYRRCESVFRWLTLVLFSYVAVVFVVHVPWGRALADTVFPRIHLDGKYLSMFIAVLGTTISPYLFFWQAAQEAEEIRTNDEQEALRKKPQQASEQYTRIRVDTYVGMAFSNLVGFAIIIAAAATLNARHVTDIQTSAQAAEALRPIAGKLAAILFGIGIVGTGLLAVPALAGSAAYAVGEALKWPTGLDRKPLGAKGFYGVFAVATVLGLAMNLPMVQRHTHLSPIKALFWSAVINGVAAAPIMAVMMFMFGNRKVMGQFARGSRILKLMGWIATGVMALAAVGMFATWNS